MYYAAQFLPHCTTTATTNHCSSSDHYSSTDHCPLYHTAHQPVQSSCTNQFVSHINRLSQFESNQLQIKLSQFDSNQLLIQLIQYESDQLHIRKLVPILLNWTNMYQDSCVPMPNQPYTRVNLIKFYDRQPTLLTWPSSSSKRHIWETKRLHMRSTKRCPITLNSMTPQPTSIIVKEDLTVKHDKPYPTNLNQEDTRLNQLCQT